MARPQKERVICSAPRFLFFAPQKSVRGETVVLTLDEYEVIRLHDLEHLSQAHVASQMLVSRPTVTALLNSAHEKLADAIVNGKSVAIKGGNCRICEIGHACPREKEDGTCQKKHRCCASCRIKQNETDNF
ncbi:MAG: DUF134 domain-containing protein [Clostridia bacterium]|nr:DUF134 domain-containing protein [Clostridia bacterium]